LLLWCWGNVLMAVLVGIIVLGVLGTAVTGVLDWCAGESLAAAAL